MVNLAQPYLDKPHSSRKATLSSLEHISKAKVEIEQMKYLNKGVEVK